jgi:hypothetical protein
MAAHGRGLAGSGEPTASRPQWLAQRASASPIGHSAREREGSKGLEWHDHVRAWPTARMAIGWSRLHGELYLGREWTLGEVEDVCGLKTVMWLKGIGQWH